MSHNDQSLPLTLYTFGDSILDAGWYNDRGLDPGQLLIRNDDELFPEFRGQNLSSHGPVRLEHRAVDSATVDPFRRKLGTWRRVRQTCFGRRGEGGQRSRDWVVPRSRLVPTRRISRRPGVGSVG